MVNVIVLWNTFYMEAALEHLKLQGFEVNPEDVARLSPLKHKQINMLGRYQFSLPEYLQQGKRRPLNFGDGGGAIYL